MKAIRIQSRIVFDYTIRKQYEYILKTQLQKLKQSKVKNTTTIIP